MGKSNFTKNLVVGLKALGGSLIHAFIMFVIVLLVAFLVGGAANIGSMLMALLIIVYVISSVIILGWIYRGLWKWK